jgi:hypothetical protein
METIEVLKHWCLVDSIFICSYFNREKYINFEVLIKPESIT